jgi:hypothetical protein
MLQKLTVTRLVKEFYAFYGSWSIVGYFEPAELNSHVHVLFLYQQPKYLALIIPWLSQVVSFL